MQVLNILSNLLLRHGLPDCIWFEGSYFNIRQWAIEIVFFSHKILENPQYLIKSEFKEELKANSFVKINSFEEDEYNILKYL